MPLLFACGEEEPRVMPYAGHFMAESLTSNTPVDLNYDGVYSTDFLAEFGHILSSSKTNLRILHEPYQDYLGGWIDVPNMTRGPEEYGVDQLTVASYRAGILY